MTRTVARQRPLGMFFDDLFEDFFTTPQKGREAAPALNVAETVEAYQLSFELPGVPRDQIHVQLDGDQLVVSAERKFEDEKTDGADYRRVEHRYGQFTRTVALPKDVDQERIAARHEHGVLTVTIPKTEPSSARRIEIAGE